MSTFTFLSKLSALLTALSISSVNLTTDLVLVKCSSQMNRVNVF